MEHLILPAAIALAATVQAAAGFGFALLAFPLLTLLLPPAECAVLITGLGLLTNLSVMIREREHLMVRRVALLIAAGAAGVLPGVFLLRLLDERTLKILLSAVILVFTLLQMRNIRFTPASRKLSYGLAGFTGGVLQGAAGMSGPPIVLFLNGEGLSRDQMRANLTLFGTVLCVLTTTSYGLNGMIRRETLLTGARALAALAAGTVLGHLAGRRIPEEIFRRGTLILILTACANQLIRSL